MGKFLITVWPFTGHINLNLALAHTLRQRGHEVAFYTGASACPGLVKQGFTCFPFSRHSGEAIEQLLRSGYYEASSAWQRLEKQKAILRAFLVDSLPAQIADQAEVLDAWQPDAIVCDPTMWGPILVLHETRKIPVAVFSWTIGCLLPGRDGPPPGLGPPSPRNWRLRLLDTVVGETANFLTRDIRQAANDVRVSFGLPRLKVTVTEHAGTMPLYLVTSAPGLDYIRRDLPPSVHYVGPCLWTRPDQEQIPAWMESTRRDQPWVFVTEGTLTQARPLLMQAAARGLANLPVQVIMATGVHRNPAELGLDNLAPNIRVESWVPYSHLLPCVSAVVCNGGAATVMSTLQARVPLLVVPTEWDKPESAQRIAESGAGIRLAPERCTPERVRPAVERLLYEPSYRQAAAHVADLLAQYGGPTQACELLEKLL